MKHTLERIRDWQQTLADRRIPDLLAYGLAVFSILLGLAMVTGPEQFSQAPNLQRAFSWAIPQAWGSVFIASGALLGLGFWRDRKSGQYAAAVLTGMYCLFGMLAAEAPLTGVQGMIWSGPIIYTYAGWTSALTVLACSATKPPVRSR